MSAQRYHYTPLDLARQHGHGTVVDVLESLPMKKVSDDWVYIYYVCGTYIIHILYM